MEQLTSSEVSDALKSWLGSMAIVEVSRDQPNGRITGWVMHPWFAGVSAAERQSWIWNGFADEGNLPKWEGLKAKFLQKSTQIGLVLTYSLAEYENALDESA